MPSRFGVPVAPSVAWFRTREGMSADRRIPGVG